MVIPRHRIIYQQTKPKPYPEHPRTSILLEWKHRGTTKLIPWTQCYDLFHVAVITKVGIKHKNLLRDRGMDIPHPDTRGPPAYEETVDQPAKRQKHTADEQKKYQKAVKDTREPPVNGLPRAEAREKVASHLFMSLGDKGRRQIRQKHPGIQITDLDLCSLIQECEGIFVKPSNITIERVNLIRRIQQPGESLEHFHFALVTIVKLCELGHLTEKLVRDFFIAHINVPDIHQKFCTDPMSPEQVYRQALAYERGLETQKQIQLTTANGPPSKLRSPTSGAQPATDE